MSAPATDTEARLVATDLYRFFHAGDDETLALRGVSLRVDAGEVVAVTGPSGSGKSTLLACLAGLDEPDGGTVSVGGTRLSRRTEPERAEIRRRTIGMLFQNSNLIEHLSVLDNVLAAQRLLGAPDHRRAIETLDRLGLQARSDAAPSTLSGGESARAGLAVALANNPGVLLCDEPTGELDEHTAQQVLALLQLWADEGNAVVVVTHDRMVAESCDREIRLLDGRVVR